MRVVLFILLCFIHVTAGGLERERSELDSLILELEYSRRVLEYDPSYAIKVYEDSLRVEVAREQFADEVEDSMEPNKGWLIMTVSIGITAMGLFIISLAGI